MVAPQWHGQPLRSAWAEDGRDRASCRRAAAPQLRGQSLRRAEDGRDWVSCSWRSPSRGQSLRSARAEDGRDQGLCHSLRSACAEDGCGARSICVSREDSAMCIAHRAENGCEARSALAEHGLDMAWLRHSLRSAMCIAHRAETGCGARSALAEHGLDMASWYGDLHVQAGSRQAGRQAGRPAGTQDTSSFSEGNFRKCLRWSEVPSLILIHNHTSCAPLNGPCHIPPSGVWHLSRRGGNRAQCRTLLKLTREG